MSRIVLQGGTIAQILPQGEDVESAVHLDALSDVTITSIQTDQILKYNGSKFVNVSIDDIQADLTEIDGGTY